MRRAAGEDANAPAALPQQRRDGGDELLDAAGVRQDEARDEQRSLGHLEAHLASEAVSCARLPEPEDDEEHVSEAEKGPELEERPPVRRATVGRVPLHG